MKDPLQTETTHYEVLGLHRGAGEAEIEKAFKMGLAKRGNINKLNAARQALRQPVDRALLDLFHYDPQTLARLTPNPLDDISHLQPGGRQKTATAWERQLKANFPDPSIAHSLAVLWYWWARYAEESAAGGPGGEGAAVVGPPPDQLWETAIAYWTMVTQSKEFWNGAVAGLPAEAAGQCPAKIVDRIRNNLLDLNQQYRGRNAADRAERYQELEVALTTELRTARDVSEANLRTARGTLCCGPLMLRRMGILDTIRGQVGNALQKQPTNERLKRLLSSLSPYSTLTILIDHKKPQEALDRIDEMQDAEKQLPEVQQLRARALLEVGKQQASLGQVEEALDIWYSAMKCMHADSIKEEIRSEAVTVCQARAVALQKTQRNRAILILEKGLKFGKDEKLEITLAELLTARGIEAINEAQDKAEKGEGASPEVVKAMERGLADLDRAAKMGLKRATEQADIARGIVQRAKAGAMLTGKAADVLRRANSAADREDWDTAVNLLREVIQLAGAKCPDNIKKNLAFALNSRAVSKANRAVEMVSEAFKARDRIFEEISQRMSRSSYSEDCAMCSKSHYGSSESWFTLKLPQGGTANLCQKCAGTMRTFMDATPGPTDECIALLKAAQSDLNEAQRLDPTSQAVAKNMKDVNETLSQFQGMRAKAGAGGGGGTSAAAGSESWLGGWLSTWWFWILMAIFGLASKEEGARGLAGLLMVVIIIAFIVSGIKRLAKGS